MEEAWFSSSSFSGVPSFIIGVSAALLIASSVIFEGNKFYIRFSPFLIGLVFSICMGFILFGIIALIAGQPSYLFWGSVIPALLGLIAVAIEMLEKPSVTNKK